ncbi:hypothetical protein M3Y95_00977100 [Aphelenchoides besseyi]|nr:hypothetical protein M3Y95_00977100 [Aphelenchoides besseyi]
MFVQFLWFFVLLNSVYGQLKCPDGNNALQTCNQETKVCEIDFDFQCSLLSDQQYYCCADDKGNDGGEECVDTNSNCEGVKTECNSELLRDTLARECRKTCKFCNADDITSTTSLGSSSTETSPETSPTTIESSSSMDTTVPTTEASTSAQISSTVESTTNSASSSATQVATTDSDAPTVRSPNDDGECKDTNENCNTLSKGDCTLESIRDLVVKECRRTCNLCASLTVESTTQESTTNPTTNNPTTTPESSTTSESKSSTVPNGDCVDTQDCSDMAKLCNDQSEEIKNLAHERCPKTCGICSSTTPAQTTEATTSAESSTESVSSTSVVPTTLDSTSSSVAPTTEIALTSQSTSTSQDSTSEASTTVQSSTQQSTSAPLTSSVATTSESVTTHSTTPSATTHEDTSSSPDGCQDTNPRCSTMKDTCKDQSSIMKDLMREQCKKTCGYCDESTTIKTIPSTTVKPTTSKPTQRPTTRRPTRRTPRPTRRTPQSTRRPTTRRPIVRCRNKMQQCAMWDRHGFCSSNKIAQKKKKEMCGYTCKMC